MSVICIIRKQVSHTVIPPACFCLKTTSGGRVFNRIPTASNSISRRRFCSADFVASTIGMRSDKIHWTQHWEGTYSEEEWGQLFLPLRRLVDLDLGLWQHLARYQANRAVVFWLLHIRAHQEWPKRSINLNLLWDNEEFKSWQWELWIHRPRRRIQSWWSSITM